MAKGHFAKSLIGNKYGDLTVESRAANRGRYAYWNCICSCGNKTVVRGEHLRRGETVSCRVCGSGWHRKEMVGLIFGKLTVVEFSGLGNKGVYMWKCLCSCGKTVVARGSHLRTGATLSCGCNRIISNTKHGKTGTPEHRRWLSRRRRDKVLGTDHFWSLDMEFALKKRFDSCVLCGSKDRLEVDHLLPVNSGFGLAPDNAVLLCKSCNSTKNSKYITELVPEIRRKLIEASCTFQDYWESVSYQYD